MLFCGAGSRVWKQYSAPLRGVTLVCDSQFHRKVGSLRYHRLGLVAGIFLATHLGGPYLPLEAAGAGRAGTDAKAACRLSIVWQRLWPRSGPHTAHTREI
jgi:hypothetical protein